MALIAVIAVSIVGTVIVLRPDANGGDGQSPNGGNSNSEFASANDTGPVNIITEDPTCAAWGSIARDYVSEVNAVEWNDRDPSVPATAWTPEQRTMYETVGSAMGSAAKSVGNLRKKTPHRVMRELYGQYIAYVAAFVETVPTYEAQDTNLAAAADKLLSLISAICSAIDYGSAQRVAPLVSEPAPPSEFSSNSSQETPGVFLRAENTVCPDWDTALNQYDRDTEQWRNLDAKNPASEWTLEQQVINNAAGSVMTASADEMERMGRQSGNPVLQDFAVLSAQYRRAYVAAIPRYQANDNFLAGAAAYLATSINWACKAAS